MASSQRTYLFAAANNMSQVSMEVSEFAYIFCACHSPILSSRMMSSGRYRGREPVAKLTLGDLSGHHHLPRPQRPTIRFPSARLDLEPDAICDGKASVEGSPSQVDTCETLSVWIRSSSLPLRKVVAEALSHRWAAWLFWLSAECQPCQYQPPVSSAHSAYLNTPQSR